MFALDQHLCPWAVELIGGSRPVNLTNYLSAYLVN